MGQITINIAKKPNDITGDGKISASQTSTNNCFRTWEVYGKTLTTAYVDFIFVEPTVVITKINPAGPFVNGETITAGVTTWQVEFIPYVSPNESFNTQQTIVTARIFDSQGGTLLDTEVITLNHSNLFC